MTTVLDTSASQQALRPAPLAASCRFELTKLFSQWRIRTVLLVCLAAPGAFVAVVSTQASLPTDTVFGRWMHATGWAGSLVVLSFACSWGLPLLAALLAADVFAAEDRLGTWRHLLVAVRSPRRIFAAKVLASLTAMALAITSLGASSVLGGLLVVGNHPLVGLDGHLLSGSEAARAVLLAWLCATAPAVALAGVGLLGSVALGRSPMGLLLPAVLALAMNLVLVLPVPVAVRLALPSNAFLAWRGLFAGGGHLGQLLVGVVVSLTWAVVATGLAYRLFVRRDFTDLAYDGAGARSLSTTALSLGALVAGTALVVTTTTPATGSGIDRHKLEASLATAFAHLYRLQTAQLRRPDVTEAQLHSSAQCDRGGDRVADRGPGHDWRCTVSWRLPGATARGTALYQLDVTADGRYVADGDGPKEVNGSFLVHTSTGDAPNPLWQLDGHVDLL
jgi:ABC-2 type transport system permease protein